MSWLSRIFSNLRSSDITVEVTQLDINLGQSRRSCECPVALALYRTFDKRMTVGYTTCTFIDTFESYYLPENVSAFISHFDQGRPVKPFSFVINLKKDKVVW